MRCYADQSKQCYDISSNTVDECYTADKMRLFCPGSIKCPMAGDLYAPPRNQVKPVRSTELLIKRHATCRSFLHNARDAWEITEIASENGQSC